MSADIEKTIQAERNKNSVTIERVRNGFILRSHLGWFVYTDLDQMIFKLESILGGEQDLSPDVKSTGAQVRKP